MHGYGALNLSWMLVMPEHQLGPDAFGDQILAVYSSHRVATCKMHAFIEFCSDFFAGARSRRSSGLVLDTD